MAETRNFLKEYPSCHDRAAARDASSLLVDKMRRHISTIVERDSLPHICHLINGWGNAVHAGSHVIDLYGRFVQRNPKGVPFVPQRAAEGDFHPWQSFAYALMAGVDPETTVGDTKATLLEVAVGSRVLDTDDGCELGHLLYAAALLGIDTSTQFSVKGVVLDLAQLFERAIDAHQSGHFKVCRKVHLTEGLCATVAAHPKLGDYRPVVQGFLDGQLDLLAVLAAVLRAVLVARGSSSGISDHSVAAALRQSLVIERFVENHYYLAGHLIELLGLAKGLGFAVSVQHMRDASFLVDVLNRLLPEYIDRVWFPGCFLHFGHYRRALTLLEELADGSCTDRVARRRFTADFADLPPGPVVAVSRPAEDDGRFIVGQMSRRMRQEFAAAVGAYSRLAGPGLESWGDFSHFRRVLIKGWPRWLHFELLDYAAEAIDPACRDGFGVELHVENAEAPELVKKLQEVGRQLAQTLLHPPDLDHQWYRGGRLKLWFQEGTAPEQVAGALGSLIEVAIPILTPAVTARFPMVVSDEGNGVES